MLGQNQLQTALRRLAPVTAAVAVLTAALPAHAREWRITLDVSSEYIADDGYLAISESAWLPGADLGVQVGLDAGFLVGVRARFGGNPPTGAGITAYGVSFDFDYTDLLATARWHYPALPWLRPFVEAEVGATRGVMAWYGDRSQVNWGVAAGAQAGLEFRLPTGLWFDNDFSVGIELSGGFRWRQPFEFDDVAGADLGTLDAWGPFWRAGLSVMW